MCDTEFAQKRLASAHGQALIQADALGGLASTYSGFIGDRERFMAHYILEILSHELHHNMFKGSKQVYGGDGRGLGVQMVEEAKATNGLALAFKDPYYLNDEEVALMQQALPLMMPWALLRFRQELLSAHTSHQYLREGAVMLDHALKSGLLEVVRVNVENDGGVNVHDNFDDEGGFEFLRYHLGERQIREYVRRCADFVRQIAPVYHKTEGFEGELKDRPVVPDFVNIDVWQAVSRECYLADRAKKVASVGADHPDVKEIDLALEKLVPADEKIAAKVRALISHGKFEQPARFRREVAKSMGVSQRTESKWKESIDEKMEEVRKYLLQYWPQIYTDYL